MSNRNCNRREFIAQSAAATFAGAFASPFLSRLAYGASAAPNYEILEVKSVSYPHQYYYGWPTVAKRGGELLAVTSGGRRAHVCPFGRVELFRSYDNGASWTYPQIVYDSPIDDRDAGVCVTSKGTILVTSFTSLAYAPILDAEKARRAEGKGEWPDEQFNDWSSVHDRISEEQRQSELGCWMFRSTDDGVTWSKRYATPFNSPHGPISLSDGRLLYMGNELWTQEHRVGASISEDDGLTWQVKGYIGTRDGDSLPLYCELHAVEADDGRFVAQIRNENGADFNHTLQTVSKDGGETWTTPQTIGVWGTPSFLTKLKDGRLLMTYGYRREPFGIQARVSDDCGETWSEPITVYGGGASADLGYPSTVVLDDGSLFTLWYELVDGLAKLRSARWTLA